MFGRGVSPYGIGSVARSGINWSGLLSNTQKTLGIINQAIPAFYQMKPIFNNMKTMFRVVNEFNKDDSKLNNNSSNNMTNNNTENINTNNSNSNYNNINNSTVNSNINYEDGPNFFI